MYGAPHTILYQPVSDINEVMEAWLFMRRHTNQTAGIKTQEVLDNNIQIYPNPASSFINVILPETKNDKLTVELLSIQGACLYSEQSSGILHQIVLHDAQFTNGIYLLRVTGNSVNVSQRVLIQR